MSLTVAERMEIAIAIQSIFIISAMSYYYLFPNNDQVYHYLEQQLQNNQQQLHNQLDYHSLLLSFHKSNSKSG
jgi:hypothetical protein